MSITLKWEISKDQRGADLIQLKLGKYSIAQVFWEGGSSSDSGERYRCYLNLPGIKPNQGKHMTQDIAMSRAMFCANHWLKHAGICGDHGAVVEGQDAQSI